MAAEERLEPISLHQEMQRSYLEYAMSVIVGRALPDVRDGLKPVQRRILYAMHELGLTPDRPFRKCARVVGDVLGKYHPHGDQAVYDALVRLVQDFSSRYPVLDGHGNFGSVDDDPPAAMRYTETRLASISYEALLSEIGEETVNFAPNFDGSQQEPTVLPAQLPFLLLNGCSGIAVGMATSIPPHNLNELVDGLIAIIKKPDIPDEKVMQIIPGPDFPTGGEILKGSGLNETYLKGKGSIPMRGVAHIEEIQPGKGKHKRSAIIITELPYQLSKAGWIEKLADMVNENKIGGISDIRDESDREGMRVVVELRRDSDAEKVLNELNRRTSLQSNFGAILLTLVKGQPRQLSLKQMLYEFANYREITIVKRTTYKLKKTVNRLEILEGLLKALDNLKNVISMIQESKDAASASASLMVRLGLTERQSDAVLAMPLRRLTGLERENLKKELLDLNNKKTNLEKLLNNREYLLEKLIEELKTLKKKFGSKRKTKIIEGGDELLAEKVASQRPSAELQRQQALDALPSEGRLIIQNDNQVKIVSPQVLGRLHLNEESEISEDLVSAKVMLAVNKTPKLLAITEEGKIAIVRWEFAGQSPGELSNFLPGGVEKEKIVSLIKIPNNKNCSLGLLTNDGRFKRISIDEVLELSGRASTVVKLKEGTHLKAGLFCDNEGCLLFVSDIGRILKLEINQENTPLLGKLAQGPTTMKMLPGENLIGVENFNQNNSGSILLVSKNGDLFKKNIKDIRACLRGDLGEISIKLKDKKKSNYRIIDTCKSQGIVNIHTNHDRNGRIDTANLEVSDDDCLTNKLFTLKKDELITKLSPLII